MADETGVDEPKAVDEPGPHHVNSLWKWEMSY